MEEEVAKATEYIYYIKSILIFVIMYFMYKRFDKIYIFIGLLITIPLFLMCR